MAVVRHGLLDRRAQSARDQCRIFGAPDIGDKNRKTVATHARRGCARPYILRARVLPARKGTRDVAATDALHDAATDFLQDPVPDCMPQRLVDALETVDIDIQHRRAARLAPAQA